MRVIANTNISAIVNMSINGVKITERLFKDIIAPYFLCCDYRRAKNKIVGYIEDNLNNRIEKVHNNSNSLSANLLMSLLEFSHDCMLEFDAEFEIGINTKLTDINEIFYYLASDLFSFTFSKDFEVKNDDIEIKDTLNRLFKISDSRVTLEFEILDPVVHYIK